MYCHDAYTVSVRRLDGFATNVVLPCSEKVLKHSGCIACEVAQTVKEGGDVGSLFSPDFTILALHILAYYLLCEVVQRHRGELGAMILHLLDNLAHRLGSIQSEGLC